MVQLRQLCAGKLVKERAAFGVPGNSAGNAAEWIMDADQEDAKAGGKDSKELAAEQAGLASATPAT